ncbi:hypothetical protein [Flocculibacter collagenilyticus]|uniref:hypothetical protein n=1 Tax=Flocculibacter collagenilyticus TaxID=2744479 RepID=UPI0018F30A89|nr:hypothetical protein [Flocculibacter collagenilyticus]
MIKYTAIASAVLSATAFSAVADTQFNGQISTEYRYFLHEGLYPQQSQNHGSVVFEPEIYHSWNNENDSITFKPFYRWDEQDDERSHGDIRELMWLHVGEGWELRTGIGAVFWGQTESQHLVDIINQTDAVEAIDGEDKLGQPMINLTLVKDWGLLDLFILPGFRERTFSGMEGRFRMPYPVQQDDPIYESGAEQEHIDFAARWSHSIGDWEVGLSYFNGTAREPELLLQTVNNELVFTPYYAQMQQTGVDLLSVVDSWLFKFEGIYRDVNTSLVGNTLTGGDNYFAMTGGFEYTRVGVFDSIIDIGWLMEYQYDERGDNATTTGQNDIMLGARFVFNDAEGTEVLVGFVQDLDYSDSQSLFVEASSRISDNWKWRADAWILSPSSPKEVSYMVRQDDYVQLSLEFYF